MTKQEIFDEIIIPYFEDPSTCSIVSTPTETKCVYLAPDGKKCAVGKALLHPEEASNITASAYRLMMDFYSSSNSEKIWDETTDKSSNSNLIAPIGLLQEKYDGHSIEFWDNLQTIHDPLSTKDIKYTKESLVKLNDKFGVDINKAISLLETLK